MARCSSKPDELRDIEERETSQSKNGELTISKLKSSRIINFGRYNIIRNGQMQVKNQLQYQRY